MKKKKDPLMIIFIVLLVLVSGLIVFVLAKNIYSKDLIEKQKAEENVVVENKEPKKEPVISTEEQPKEEPIDDKTVPNNPNTSVSSYNESASMPSSEEIIPFMIMINSKTGTTNVMESATNDSKIKQSVKNGEVFTIVDRISNWGKLKSGAGWIHLADTKVYK